MPDSLENLRLHNLISYKSHQETHSQWTLNELIGHYVNYRKQIRPPKKSFLPEDDFGLYAVCTRFPEKLYGEIELKETEAGIFDTIWAGRPLRMIVLSRISEGEKNAIWQLFSAVPEKVQAGALRYRYKNDNLSTSLNDLFIQYNAEGVIMPYTIEDYTRDYVLKHIDKLPPDDVLKKFSPNDRVKGLSLNDRVKGLSPTDLLEYLAQEFPDMKPEEILKIIKARKKEQ